MPHRTSLRLTGLCLLVVSGSTLAGCNASRPAVTAPAPVAAEAEIARARAVVDKARAGGAEALAPVELRAASDRLARAEAALAAGDTVQAARLAREAAIDGRLADVTVLAARARRVRQLYDEVRTFDVEVDDWSFSRALFRRADIWHLHHPDTVVFPRSGLQSSAETVLMRGLLSWARWRGTRIVWTVHDLDSSDDLHPRLERWFWRYFLPRVDACVFLSEAGREFAEARFPMLAGLPSFVSEHGDFRPAYPNGMSRAEVRLALGLPEAVPVLLNFGLVRPYKDVPILIDAVRDLGAREAVLVVAGRARDATVEREVRSRAGAASNVRLHLHWVAFEDAQRYFKACDLVVLPYRRILNSGTVMLSLAFERPVLVPDRGTTGGLRERFGAEWIRLYDGDLDADELRAAIAWARGERCEAPDLSGLDWTTLAGETHEIYDAVLGPVAPATSGRPDGAGRAQASSGTAPPRQSPPSTRRA